MRSKSSDEGQPEEAGAEHDRTRKVLQGRRRKEKRRAGTCSVLAAVARAGMHRLGRRRSEGSRTSAPRHSAAQVEAALGEVDSLEQVRGRWER